MPTQRIVMAVPVNARDIPHLSQLHAAHPHSGAG